MSKKRYYNKKNNHQNHCNYNHRRQEKMKDLIDSAAEFFRQVLLEFFAKDNPTDDQDEGRT